MARSESDREDLMEEATALVERSELQCAEFPDPVVIGFRRNGSLSIFLGQDPVYQFDAEARLRRAFRDGRLYRSQHTGLAQLTRVRTDTETILQRQDLSEEQRDQFRDVMVTTLSRLLQALDASAYQVCRSVPDGSAVVPRVIPFLRRIVRNPGPWLSSAIRARRMTPPKED